MLHWKRWLLAGVLIVSSVPGTAWAMSEVDILVNKLIEKGILTQADAASIRKEMNESRGAPSPQLAKKAAPAPTQNWNWSGDLLLREEYRNRTGSGNDVNRQRMRFRYGFEAMVADHLKVGARLSTGNTTDPGSPNQSFNTSFNHKAFLLDRAFAEYSPEVLGISEAKLTGGMMANPFWSVGQMVWDEDLAFDGAAVHLADVVGPVTLFTNDGIFLLQTDITEAASLWSAQGGLILKPFADAPSEVVKNLKVTGALAYHDYRNVTNPLSESTAIATAGGLRGNSANLKDLNLLDSTFEVASQYAEIPMGVFSDWVHNAGSSASNNGFQIGLRLGQARLPFDLRKGWEGGYYFERLQSDATFGAFTDSDFGNGGTNHTGHVYWIKLAVLRNSAVQLKYYNTHEVKGAKESADTFRADWISKF
ncbi:MAG: putative porin [Candidatus Omnitrophica bacterium]|nr:putative porin [Candidatus Omnitrophota bacterium]MBI2496001.1 putative porin [Candidatus Omnitrophota bacterium]MBI3021401.1 putative porin [Candidatus Omnitrophota bacterium]MBI3083183.1 putative porin [Candidatus Omnitrophota bacterium]